MKLLVLLAPLLLLACDLTCPDGQTYEKVHNGRGFVCIPQETSAPASSSTAADSAPTCTAASAGVADVGLGTQKGLPPGVPTDVPPDGSYVLRQATSYGDVERPPVTLRMTLAKSGARLTAGVRVTESAQPGLDEAFLLTVGGGSLVKVCASRDGYAGEMLFPGADGASLHASLGWDAGTRQLYLVLGELSESFVLVFAPSV